ncbi:MAG: PDZ domain-containing protein, partial [Planctomycetota bacterium]
GKSSQVKQGHWCVATGHPGGFVADRGPVVRLGRVLEYDQELMRTDCRLSGGDSGGPLIDMRGQVIGIHSRIGTSLANNLHIPISIYLRHWEGLVRGEQWEGSSYLGVVQASGSGGAIVGRVRDDSPADRAGIQSDDIILRFGGQRVFSFDQLRQLVQMRRPGEEDEIDLIRRGKSLKLDVRIGKRPVAPDRPAED